MRNVDLRSQQFGNGGDIPQVVLDMVARSTTERGRDGAQRQTLPQTGPSAEMYTRYGIAEQNLQQYIDSLSLDWPNVAARNSAADLQRAANPHGKPRRLLGYAGEVIPPQIAAVIFRNAVGLAGGPVAAAVTGMITGTWAGWRETRQLGVSGRGVSDLYARNVSSLEHEGRAAAERGGLGGVLARSFNKLKSATTYLSRRTMEDALGVKNRQQEIRQLLYYANIDLAADGTIANRDQVYPGLVATNNRSLEGLIRHLMTQGVLSGFAEESSPESIRALADILVLAIIAANERGADGVRIIHNATLSTQQDINEHSSALKHGVYKYIRGTERALMAASGSVLVGMALDSLGLSSVPDTATQGTTQAASTTRGVAVSAATDQLVSVDESLVRFTQASQQISGNTRNILLEAAKRQGFGSVEEYLNNAGPEFAARWERLVDFADFARQYKSNPAIKSAVEIIASKSKMTVSDAWDRIVFHAQYIGDNPGQIPQFMNGDLVDLQKFTEAVSKGEYVLPHYVNTVDQAWHELAKSSLETNLFSTTSGSFEINTTPLLDAVGVFLRGLSRDQVALVIAGTSSQAEALAALAEAAAIALGVVVTAADMHNAIANKTVVHGGPVNLPPAAGGAVLPPAAVAPVPGPDDDWAVPANGFDWGTPLAGVQVAPLQPPPAGVDPFADTVPIATVDLLGPDFSVIPGEQGLSYENTLATDGALPGGIFVHIHRVKEGAAWDHTKFYLTLSNTEGYLFDTNTQALKKDGQEVQQILTQYGSYRVRYEDDKLELIPQVEGIYGTKDKLYAIFDAFESKGDLNIFSYKVLDNTNKQVVGARYLKIESNLAFATVDPIEIMVMANQLSTRYPEVVGSSGWGFTKNDKVIYQNSRIWLDKKSGEIKIERENQGAIPRTGDVLGIPIQQSDAEYSFPEINIPLPMDYPDDLPISAGPDTTGVNPVATAPVPNTLTATDDDHTRETDENPKVSSSTSSTTADLDKEADLDPDPADVLGKLKAATASFAADLDAATVPDSKPLDEDADKIEPWSGGTFPVVGRVLPTPEPRQSVAELSDAEFKTAMDGLMGSLFTSIWEEVGEEIALTGNISGGVELIWKIKDKEISEKFPGQDELKLKARMQDYLRDEDILRSFDLNDKGELDMSWRRDRLQRMIWAAQSEIKRKVLYAGSAEIPGVSNFNQSSSFGITKPEVEKLYQTIINTRLDQIADQSVRDLVARLRDICRAYLSLKPEDFFSFDDDDNLPATPNSVVFNDSKEEGSRSWSWRYSGRREKNPTGLEGEIDTWWSENSIDLYLQSLKDKGVSKGDQIKALIWRYVDTNRIGWLEKRRIRRIFTRLVK